MKQTVAVLSPIEVMTSAEALMTVALLEEPHRALRDRRFEVPGPLARKAQAVIAILRRTA